MTNVEGVSEAVTRFVNEHDPTAKVALLMTGAELATIHLGLEMVQAGLEKLGDTLPPNGPFATIREKVEALLVQGGYGGDARYPTTNASD